MARPIWTGLLRFGLLNIPIQLMPGERRSDISFRMLDSRTKAPVRYERVNAETGEEVPWKDVVKAYEYDKGSYVVLEASDIAAAAENRKRIKAKGATTRIEEEEAAEPAAATNVVDFMALLQQSLRNKDAAGGGGGKGDGRGGKAAKKTARAPAGKAAKPGKQA